MVFWEIDISGWWSLEFSLPSVSWRAFGSFQRLLGRIGEIGWNWFVPSDLFMPWTLTSANQLSAAQLDAWRQLLVRAPHFESPFFTPEYTQAVAKVVPHIEVAMLHGAAGVEVVFPFERAANGRAIAVGRDIADYQGAIYARGVDFDCEAMLKFLGLTQWRFDHLFPCDGALASKCWVNWASPQIDLSNGVEDYLRELYARHKRIKRTFVQSERGLQRDLGPVRMEFASNCPHAFDLLLDWKCFQYEASKRWHPFRQQWVRTFLADAVHHDSLHFAGCLSVMYAGTTPVAINYSLRSQRTMHVLICAYDPQFARYSPGLLCFSKMIELCETAGVEIIDLGKGVEFFKRRLMNSAAMLGEGHVDLIAPRAWVRQSLEQSRYRFLRSRLSNPMRQLARSSAIAFPVIRRIFSMR